MSTEFEVQMAVLKGQFDRRLRHDSAELRSLRERPQANSEDRIGEIAHRVAGLAAMFGYDDLTVLAKLADNAVQTGDNASAIDNFVAAVARAVAA